MLTQTFKYHNSFHILRVLPRTPFPKSTLFIQNNFAHLANMSSHSAVCCKIPPVIAKDYTPKGKYETIGGLKTYVTGPDSATKGIFLVYDIFGFFPQSLQGADILATSDEAHQYKVFIPDFFEGTPCNIAWYPPTDDEKKQKLGAWFATRGPPMALEKLPKILKDIKSFAPSITAFGAIGFCWGGKVVSLTSGADSPWKVAGQSSPAFVDPEDAAKTTIPMLMLASKDETAEDVKKYEANLKVDKHVEIVATQIHGYMTARGNLEDAENKKEYEIGYKKVLEFFGKHL